MGVMRWSVENKYFYVMFVLLVGLEACFACSSRVVHFEQTNKLLECEFNVLVLFCVGPPA